MNRRTLFAFASLSALALDGCLLNWNQFRPSDAAADVTSTPDVPAPLPDAAPDVMEIEDTGVADDTGMVDTGIVDTGVVDTGVGMDAGSDARPDAVADSRPDALPDAAPDAPAGDADPGCTGPVVVNEVQTYGMGGGTNEFVELLNTGGCEVSLSGWQLSYRSSSGLSVMPLYRFVAADRLSAGGYFLIFGTGFGDGGLFPQLSSGIADSASVAVLDPMGRVVDSVAFGSVTLPHPYAEPTAGPAAAHRSMVAMSVARVPNGQDTNNNATDFREGTPSPGLPNP